jgi:hypothetical protein
MNKRIRELEDQAGYIQVDDRFSGGYITFNTEKFAELIVKECVEKLKETKHVKVELPFLQSADIKTIQELPLSVYITDLLEHFGVEE